MKKHFLSVLVVASTVAMAQSPRLSLYEEFTGENCPPCASTNPGLNMLLRLPVNVTKVVPIKWQVPIPSAPTTSWSLYQTDKSDIDWRYSGGSNGYGYMSQWTSTDSPVPGIDAAPTGMIDGKHQWSFGAPSDHPATLSSSVLAAAQSYTSPFTIQIDRAWNAGMTALDVTVHILATATVSATGNLVFRLVMTERNMHFATAPGSNGEKDFEDVARAAFPTLKNGTALSPTWAVSQTQTWTMTCTLPSYIKEKAEVALVGFIQDDGDRSVLQAALADTQGGNDDAALVSMDLPDVSCAAAAAATVMVLNHGQNALQSVTITPQFDNGPQLTPVIWTGSLNPGQTTVVSIPGVTANAGAHAYHCLITGVNSGTDSYTGNNAAVTQFIVPPTPVQYTVVQTFSLGAFPPAGWSLMNKDNGVDTWTRKAASAYGIGTGAACYGSYANGSPGDMDDLYLPAVDLSAVSSQSLFFDYAYATYPGYSDGLMVQISEDCGAHWQTLFSQSGNQLATASPQTSEFFPTASQWTTAVVSLAGYQGNDDLIRFRAVNANGNNMWLDNINISTVNTVGMPNFQHEQPVMAIYPNPSTGTFKVTLPRGNWTDMKVVDATGRTVKQMDPENDSLNVAELAPGVYFVRAVGDAGSVCSRVIVMAR